MGRSVAAHFAAGRYCSRLELYGRAVNAARPRSAGPSRCWSGANSTLGSSRRTDKRPRTETSPPEVPPGQRPRTGGTYQRHPGEAIVEKMVELGRPGRAHRAGFYDYDESGKRIGLWPGLVEHFPTLPNPAGVDLHELQERMLVIEALESARCLEEGVLITVPEANIGSIMGIGFPPWTGGVLQYITGYRDPREKGSHGVAGFVRRAGELAETFGDRFTPNTLLRKEAEHPDTLKPGHPLDA